MRSAKAGESSVQAEERPSRPAEGPRYDTDFIKSESERLLAAYLGLPGKVSGSRTVWDCPRCGEPKLSLQRATGSAGCLNAGCDVAAHTDVIEVVANLEGLATRGGDFKAVCSLCYRLLGVPEPGGERGAATLEDRERHTDTERATPTRADSDTGEAEDGEGGGNAATDADEDLDGEEGGSDGDRREENGRADHGVAEGGTAASHEAFDRWYGLVEGRTASREVSAPRPYSPSTDASPVPDAAFAEEAEIQWAALLGAVAALAFWYYVGASEGWLAGEIGWLPTLPWPLTALRGIPAALVLAVVACTLALLRAWSRRLALRRHFLGRRP